MLIGIFIPDKALALLGADAGLIGLGRNYMRIILIATPFFMSNYTFTAFARNDGAPSIAMIGSISGSIFNIIFDYIFMFPVGLWIFRSRTGYCNLSDRNNERLYHTLQKQQKPCRIPLEKTVIQTPDFLLSARSFRICRGIVFRCDRHCI